MENILGKTTFIKEDPLNLIDGISSLGQRFRAGISIAPPGNGVEEQINWSVDELREAIASNDPQKKNQKASTSVITARRALSCLFDWILNSYSLNLCKDRVKLNAEKKSEILLRLGYFDEVTQIVLKNGIDIRNIIEHNYETVGVEQAGYFVELCRRFYADLKANKFLGWAPISSDTIQGGTSYSTLHGAKGSFYGWTNPFKPFLMIASYDIKPWIGIIEPKNKDFAEVRYSFIENFLLEQILEIYQIMDFNISKVTNLSGRHKEDWILHMKEVGLLLV